MRLAKLTKSFHLFTFLWILSFAAIAEDNAMDSNGYIIQPGDILTISVWKEIDLQAEVLVRPDGGLSFPLIGSINASQHTVVSLEKAIIKQLKKYIPDPVVTVMVNETAGNVIYVIGKVNRPGNFPLKGKTDVMHALSMAGGANPFAALNDIIILRRINGAQKAIRFRYGDVEQGKKLEQNILLQSGDTVVVP